MRGTRVASGPRTDQQLSTSLALQADTLPVDDLSERLMNKAMTCPEKINVDGIDMVVAVARLQS